MIGCISGGVGGRRRAGVPANAVTSSCAASRNLLSLNPSAQRAELDVPLRAKLMTSREITSYILARALARGKLYAGRPLFGIK
ncbi:hypothetical protein EVAR_21415_1 [Eumeta japonica]|uniref:Uncharacterized protein n=1 Tax=Eumeta variegata TaxID=151549 RepID=A0A4C1VGY5_EUMVA|nr:hypothetical protein EVAR_21415_1 [Eumeta japonica]